MMPFSEEKGVTLVELLLAVAISSLVASGLGTAVYQFVTISERSGDTQKALSDVQNAGHWLYLDGKQATDTDLADGAPPVSTMTLGWTADSQEHTSTYYLSGTQLKRDHNGTAMTVARNVTDVQFSRSGQLITVSLTSTPNGRWDISKQPTYYIWVRPLS